MDAVEQVWRKDFINYRNAIPPEWLVTVEDGSQWIGADYSDTKIVRMYWAHCIAGAARGWL